jgi:hypothetical protein
LGSMPELLLSGVMEKRVTKASRRAEASIDAITADLVAVLVAVTDGEPKIMTIAKATALPSGPFQFAHRSLQMGLRAHTDDGVRQELA